MCITEYDEERTFAEQREEGFEEGVEKGIAKGLAKGLAKGRAEGRAERDNEILARMKAFGLSDNDIKTILSTDP